MRDLVGGQATRPKTDHPRYPESIRFFHDSGLDYVSCSPFRLPIARVAAAQAAIAAPR